MTGDIGWAVTELRLNGLVRRAGWNGKGMYLVLISGSSHKGAPPRDPYVQMFTAQQTLIPWVCSQADLLATDWERA